MKSSILFVAAMVALLSFSVNSKAENQAAAPSFELIIKKDGVTRYFAVYSEFSACLITGMSFKKEGYSFECNGVNND